MTMAAPEEPHDDAGVSSPATTRPTATATATATTTATPTSIPIPLPNKIPVDRDWLQKLLKRHANKNVATSNSNNADNADNANANANDDDHIPILAVAPMVDQSDLPFRLLCRKYGANLCFTPMVHAKLYTTSPEYRKKFTLAQTPDADRPLIAQVCGGDAATVLQAALMLEPYCDGIDINCGCPQQIAKRGKYGAFLLEETADLLELVELLTAHLSVPLSVKVRLLPAVDRDESVAQSLALYTRLVDAGVHMLSIHGRNRHQKGPSIGQADWAAVRAVVDLLGHRIPILANGSMGNAQDCAECLAATGADGAMVSEAILEYPPLFLSPWQLQQRNLPPRLGRVQLAREYLDLCLAYPPNQGGQGSGIKTIRGHLHKFLHADLQAHTSIRKVVVESDSFEDLEQAVTWLQDFQSKNNHNVETETLSWYMRHRTLTRNEWGVTINLSVERQKSEAQVKVQELVEDAADCFACLFDE